MAAAAHNTVLDQIGQTQAPLPTSIVAFLGLVVFAAIMLPTWLLVRHVTTMAHEGAHALVGWAFGGKVTERDHAVGRQRADRRVIYQEHGSLPFPSSLATSARAPSASPRPS